MSKLHIDVDFVYPIGSIYISVVNVNPTSYWGGEWEPFALGRTLIGVDSSQNEFEIAEKTGGEKAHSLTEDENGEHIHVGRIAVNQSVTGPARYWFSPNGTTGAPIEDSNVFSSSIGILSSGKSKPHNNLQPYITVYMWKRIA